MNLATAKSTLRSKEIGLRKVLGAGRKNIIAQFYGESLITTFLAMIVALILVQLILPTFNLIAERELTFNFLDTEIIVGIIILIIITGLIAGSYPALYLSSFRPIIILKGIVIKGKSGAIFRKSLVVFQFSLSIILIIGSIIIYNQQKYLLTKDIGIDKENVIVIQMQGEVNNKFTSLKPLLLQNPRIESVSRSSHLPIMIGSNTGSITWDGRDDDNDLLVGFTTVDNDFEKAVGFEMVEGRFFSDVFGTDSACVVLNESAVKFMNLKNPIGRWIQWGQGEEARFPVIGVVKDFNFLDLSESVSPMALFYGQMRCRYIFIKSNNKNINETANSIEETWNEVFPTYPFEYTLLNDRYKAMYASEEKTGSLFKYFTILAIIISCLGLFGLASYMAEQKTKEIGIRKVLGASESSVIYNMALEFIKWVIIANIIAWPVSWYLGEQFLDQYANRSHLGITIFLFSAIASIIVALITVSYQSFKAARENPVNALRHE
jgi:ABC-type antimicrobial peptide transport system permease subunit